MLTYRIPNIPHVILPSPEYVARVADIASKEVGRRTHRAKLAIFSRMGRGRAFGQLNHANATARQN